MSWVRPPLAAPIHRRLKRHSRQVSLKAGGVKSDAHLNCNQNPNDRSLRLPEASAFHQISMASHWPPVKQSIYSQNPSSENRVSGLRGFSLSGRRPALCGTCSLQPDIFFEGDLRFDPRPCIPGDWEECNRRAAAIDLINSIIYEIICPRASSDSCTCSS